MNTQEEGMEENSVELDSEEETADSDSDKGEDTVAGKSSRVIMKT